MSHRSPISGMCSKVQEPQRVTILRAGPSPPVAHVRTLTVVLDMRATLCLLNTRNLRVRMHLRELLEACTALRRLHLHFEQDDRLAWKGERIRRE